jgi:glucosamine 6-phosphate synthetase-like amidotransferase/phosphosugar isomerase protein
VCRIAAFSRHPSDTFDASTLTSALMLRMEAGGPDATGTAWRDDAGDVMFHTRAIRGSRYADENPMDPNATVGLVHTRWATQGDPEVETNNHPINVPGIVGVHNGTIDNDAAVWRRLGQEPTAEVDSAALFAAILDAERTPERAFRGLRGTAAAAWLRVPTNGALHLARWQMRPLVVAWTTRGSAIAASTDTIIIGACREAGVRLESICTIPEGNYLRLQDGFIRERRPLPVQASRAARKMAEARSW